MPLNLSDSPNAKRHSLFNVHTNGLLDEINRYLINSSEVQYHPSYTGVLKQPSKFTIDTWQNKIDAIDRSYKDDDTLGYIFYKLVLCQALVHYLRGDNDKALYFFDGAMTFERYDIVKYYLPIVKKLGGKLPKAERNQIMSSRLKKFGKIALGIVIVLGFIIGIVLFLVFGSLAAAKIEPVIAGITIVIFLLNILMLPFLIFRKARMWYAVSILISSYVYGLELWLMGFIATYVIWGIGAVVIGIFFAGIGVVPIGILATGLHHDWSYFWNMLILLPLTFGLRIWAIWLGDRPTEQKTNRQFISP